MRLPAFEIAEGLEVRVDRDGRVAQLAAACTHAAGGAETAIPEPRRALALLGCVRIPGGVMLRRGDVAYVVTPAGRAVLRALGRYHTVAVLGPRPRPPRRLPPPHARVLPAWVDRDPFDGRPVIAAEGGAILCDDPAFVLTVCAVAFVLGVDVGPTDGERF